MNGKLFYILALLFIPQISIAAQSDKCNELTVEFSTTPTAPQSTESMRRSLAVISNSGSSDVLLLGDSLFQGWEPFLAKDFPGKTVWNFSVGGDRTQNLIWRLEQLQVSAPPPKAALILIGTNNLYDSGQEGCAAFEGIRSILKKTQETWPAMPIFVVTLPPRGADFLQSDAERKGVNRSILLIQERFKNVYPVPIDDQEFTCGQYGKGELNIQNILLCKPDMAYKCGNYKDDNLHFQRSAYLKIREYTKRASIKYLGKDIFE